MKKKPQFTRKQKIYAAVFVVIVFTFLVIKISIWDKPANRWLIEDLYLKPDQSKKLTLAYPIQNFSFDEGQLVRSSIGDASHLQTVDVAAVFQPETKQGVQKYISLAKKLGKKISISGVRHSMGGQAFSSDSIHLDMTKYDDIRYDAVDQTVTVQSGATWKQIQAMLEQKGRAVKVMQDSNIFTVGGSLSVNVHGKDPRFTSLISTINYFTLITPDGAVVRCDRENNPELFSAVIGGYGLFGVIDEVNLQTTENDIYEFALNQLPTNELVGELEKKQADDSVHLVEAHLSIDGGRFLEDALLYSYKTVESPPSVETDISGASNIWMRKAVFQFSRLNDFGKFTRFELERSVGPLLDAKYVNRNTAMAAPVYFLENNDESITDILQEYFVPKEHFYEFLEEYKNLLQKNRIHLLNVTVRLVPKDTEALLSYAQADMLGVVVYYQVRKNDQGVSDLESFTRELIDYLNTIGATYYLCYGAYYDMSQLQKMYPNVGEFLKLKGRHDPEGLFSNEWLHTIDET